MIENSDQLVSAGEDAMENFRKVMLELLLSMGKSMGKNLISGMLQGWKENIAWVETQFVQSGGGLVGALKRSFGIHSPSTVFRDEVGRYMAQGIGVGFTEEMAQVTRQVNQSMAQLSEPPVSGSVPASARLAGSAAAETGDAGSADAIAAAVRSALQGAGVYLNGRRVGVLVTQSQNSAAVARGQSQVYV